MTSRRTLLQTAALAAANALLPLRAQAPESRIDILLEEPIGTIAPEIYGHFVEHLGGVVYDGIWVGEGSRIANVGGLRKALIDALAKVKPGVIRWPGGCFADQYDWRDGVGPREKRPKRTNFWVDSPEWPKNAKRNGPQVYDPNHLGTVEFARFCRYVGAAPYFAANLRSLPAQEYWRWIEYCNSPEGSSTLAEQRAADGEAAPLNVRYWGVGNESWGCGGNFAPEEYAVEFRRFSAWAPDYGLRLCQIPSGPNGGDLNWTRKFFERARNGMGSIWGWALHHYSWNASGGRTTNWFEGKRDAVNFDAEQYYEILKAAQEVESLITSHWDAMGEFDRQHRIRLVVDEWGSWYAPGTEPFPEALIGQQNTMRDAVLAGLTLDAFNRHCDKVGMANIAQLVNCLQSLFLAHEDRFCVTPTYHVFDLYAAHQRAQGVRSVFSSSAVSYTRNGAQATLKGLAGSASRNESRVTLTATNPSLDRTIESEVVVRGARVTAARATTLAHARVQAHNSFDGPREVEPKTAAVTLTGGRMVYRFPPASVTKIELDLG